MIQLCSVLAVCQSGASLSLSPHTSQAAERLISLGHGRDEGGREGWERKGECSRCPRGDPFHDTMSPTQQTCWRIKCFKVKQTERYKYDCMAKALLGWMRPRSVFVVGRSPHVSGAQVSSCPVVRVSHGVGNTGKQPKNVASIVSKS